MSQRKVNFVKLHGCKNSFVVLLEPLMEDPSRFAEYVCRSDIGIGSDGLLIVEKKVGKDTYSVDFRNPDGSHMGMCGNGVRCVTRALELRGLLEGNSTTLIVEGREVPCEIIGSNIRSCLGNIEHALNPPKKEKGDFGFGEVEFCRLSIGNPHCVIEVKDVSTYPVREHGPKVEMDSRFPAKTNVEFIQLLSTELIRARIWERVAGETKACGSGACASVAALYAQGRCGSSCSVELPGGVLEVQIESDKTCYLTGPAEFICEGSIAYEI